MGRLSSASKLDRDKAIRQLSEAVEKKEGEVIETVFENLLGIRDQFKDDFGSVSWEQKLGYLTAYTIILKSEKRADIDTDHLISVCLDWIETESDVRVREAVAQLLGAVTECQGVLVLERSRSRLLGLARSHLQRRIEPDRELSDAAERGKLMDRKEWKNLAAWKDLELCLNCLAKIFSGLDTCSINGHLDAETLDILLTCVTHQNRFVRDTGYKVLTAVLVEQPQKTDDEDRCSLITEHLASGLSDNWSMVRLSSLQATRQFLLSLPPSDRGRHCPVLLPRICLNRYFSAEGVKRQAQRAWVDICGQEGRALLSQHIEATVAYYRGCTEAESQPVREAACHCLAEVASKLDPEAVSPHLASILQSLTSLTSDPCWPVRDAASLATSILAKSHPASCQSEVDTLLGIYLSNLRHGMAPVRQGAATCLANIATVFPEVMSRIVTAIRQGLSDLEQQPRDPRSDLTSSVSITAVAGLSKGDLGGCTEAIGLHSEAQPWEVAEASVLAMAELCKVKQCHESVSKLIPEMFQSCRSRRSDTQTISFCATVVRKLAEIVTILDKRFWKPHLELEVVFTCLESDHPGARAAGEQCLRVLGRVLGPSILRGRVENYLPQYLQTHDAIMSGSGMPLPMGRVTASSPFPTRPPFASSQPLMMAPRASVGSHPSLGGTPPA